MRGANGGSAGKENVLQQNAKQNAKHNAKRRQAGHIKAQRLPPPKPLFNHYSFGKLPASIARS
ncbi:hypothetical protein PT2222_90329 [Paraburkholderia tropica]